MPFETSNVENGFGGIKAEMILPVAASAGHGIQHREQQKLLTSKCNIGINGTTQQQQQLLQITKCASSSSSNSCGSAALCLPLTASSNSTSGTFYSGNNGSQSAGINCPQQNRRIKTGIKVGRERKWEGKMPRAQILLKKWKPLGEPNLTEIKFWQ